MEEEGEVEGDEEEEDGGEEEDEEEIEEEPPKKRAKVSSPCSQFFIFLSAHKI